MPIEKDSIERTSFVTPDVQYEFFCQPFGLVNDPSGFSRLVSKVSAPLDKILENSFIRGVIQAYIDDIMVASRDIDSSLRALVKVLIQLRAAGLKLSKCKFLMNKVDFLDYELSAKGIRKPGAFKTKSIEKFTKQKNLHGFQRFIGLTIYFCKFIKDFASIGRGPYLPIEKGCKMDVGTRTRTRIY